MRLECGCDVDINGEYWEVCEAHKKSTDSQMRSNALLGRDTNLEIIINCFDWKERWKLFKFYMRTAIHILKTGKEHLKISIPKEVVKGNKGSERL